MELVSSTVWQYSRLSGTVHLFVILHPRCECSVQMQSSTKYDKKMEDRMRVPPHIEFASPSIDRLRKPRRKEEHSRPICSTFSEPPRHAAPLPHDIPAVHEQPVADGGKAAQRCGDECGCFDASPLQSLQFWVKDENCCDESEDRDHSPIHCL